MFARIKKSVAKVVNPYNDPNTEYFYKPTVRDRFSLLLIAGAMQVGSPEFRRRFDKTISDGVDNHFFKSAPVITPSPVRIPE